MEAFILYLLKSSICLSLLYGLYYLILRNTTFFKLTRVYFSLGIIISLLLPIISIKKIIKIPIVDDHINNITTSNLANDIVQNEINTVWMILGILIAIGAAIRLAFVIKDIFKIYHLYSVCHIQIKEGKKYCINSRIKSPFSFGNCIFISDKFFSETEQNIIIKHELIHIKQYHIIDLLLGQIILLVQWFNPFVWLYIQRQKQNLEYLTDQTVVEDGISMAEYQATLLNSVLDYQVFTLAQSFNYSNPLKRINMMKRKKTNNLRKLSLLLTLPLIGGFLWANSSTIYIPDEQSFKGKFIGVSYAKNDSTLIAGKPLILVDGVEMKDLDDISASNIESMTVLKNNSATDIYGEKGKDGVVIITMRKDSLATEGIQVIGKIAPLNQSNSENSKILTTKQTNGVFHITDSKENISSDFSDKLLLVNGTEVNNLNNLNSNDIKSISILKDRTLTKPYGEKGKNGVIIVTTKKAS